MRCWITIQLSLLLYEDMRMLRNKSNENLIVSYLRVPKRQEEKTNKRTKQPDKTTITLIHRIDRPCPPKGTKPLPPPEVLPEVLCGVSCGAGDAGLEPPPPLAPPAEEEELSCCGGGDEPSPLRDLPLPWNARNALELLAAGTVAGDGSLLPLLLPLLPASRGAVDDPPPIGLYTNLPSDPWIPIMPGGAPPTPAETKFGAAGACVLGGESGMSSGRSKSTTTSVSTIETALVSPAPDQTPNTSM